MEILNRTVLIDRYRTRVKLPLAIFAMFVLQNAGAFTIEIPKITCEMMENPSGISAPPRLGWELRSTAQGEFQTAYQIMVSTDRLLLEYDQADVWDTKKIKSGESQFVPFGGNPLKKGERYYWKVKVWDAAGKPSSWSEVGYWDMAPDLSTFPMQWVGAITREQSKLPEGRNFHSPELRKKEKADLWNNVEPLAKQSILLRKSFQLQKKIVRATAYISGLGHYELVLNGKKVGNSQFAPLWSDYDKTVYYNTFNVDSILVSGENVIGVWLGNGMYNVSGNRYRKLLVSFGPPTLFFRMDILYKDGSKETITSDQTWKYTASPITFNCIYGGEDYNANLEQQGWDKAGFNDSVWKKVVIQEPPKGKLTPQLAAPVEVINQYDIKSVKEPKPNVYVLDMGQNLSGFPTIKVRGKKGQTLKLVPGEGLNDEGLVSQKRSGGPYHFEYQLKGDGVEEWQPRFSYYGYQYIQVENVNFKSSLTDNDKPVLLDVKSNFIYNSSGETGSFTSSNEIFNQAHALINNAVKSNWQSVFTDCPHREKLGWLEETHLNGPGLLYNYNLAQYIPKVMRDIADGQRDDGLVPSIVPEYVIFGGDFTDSPEWGVAAVVLPWMYYEFYGDASLIEQYYPVMKKYVDYLTSKSSAYIVSHGLGDWYDYGDHAAGYSKNSPIPLSATAHYYLGVILLKKAAYFLNKDEDAAEYEELSKKIKEAYNQKYFNPETKQYATGSQYSNAVSLYLGLTGDQHKQAVLDNLVDDIRKRGNRLTTGDVGNRYLYQALAENDKNEVMYAMHNHYDTPGYGFQIKFGLTTLTEQWDPRKGNSWNHFMMGQIEEWFYKSLAGIVPDEKVPGFKHFIVQPNPVGDLTFVDASHHTLYGSVKVSWKKTGKSFSLTVHVPVNTTADILLPVKRASEIRVNDKLLKEPDKENGVISFDGDQSLFKVSSGVFVIDCKF